MNERAPFSFNRLNTHEAANDTESVERESIEALEAFDAELREHLERHIEQGDFFHLLATYMGFLEETAADPDSIPEELRDMQVRLCRSVRGSLQQLAAAYHILPNVVPDVPEGALQEARLTLC